MTIKIQKPELQALISQRNGHRPLPGCRRVPPKSDQVLSIGEGGQRPRKRDWRTAITMMEKMSHKDKIVFGEDVRCDRRSLAQLFTESPFKGTDMEFPHDKTPLREIEL